MVEDRNDAGSSEVIDGRFRILEKLGEGAMGQVFLCNDTKLDRKVAVKLLVPGASHLSVQRFHIEAKSLAQSNHKNILSIMDFGAAGSRLYLVVEYIDGVSLASIIQKNGAIPLADALPIILQICEGLGYAHERKILHRDIKPSNVMLMKNKDDKFDVKLVDFGLAKQVESDQYLTKTGRAMGTPPYMSPETVGGQELDERSDIYSLGCLIFEMLTGTPPFLGPTSIETMTMHVREPAPSLFEYSDIAFPPRVEAIVGKCLKKDPAERYQKAKQLAEAFRTVDLRAAPSIAGTNYDTSMSKPVNTKFGWQKPLLSISSLALLSAGLFLYFGRVTEPIEPIEKSKTVVIDKYDPSVFQFAESELKPRAFEATDPTLHKQYLEVQGELSNQELKDVAEKFKYLKIVNLYRLRPDTALQYFSKLPLDELRINQCEMEEKDYQYLYKMKTLKTLRLLNSVRVPISAINGLASLGKLECLEIKNIGSSAGQFDAISHLPKLRTLELMEYDDIDKLAIASLKKSTSMRTLAFENTKLSADSFVELSKLDQVENLALLGVELTSENLKDLHNHRLKRLQISTDKTSDHAVLQLNNLSALEVLDLRGTKLSMVAEQKIRIRFPRATVLTGELMEADPTRRELL